LEYTRLKKLKEKWTAEENADFQGWDFSRLNEKWQEEPLKWDYVKIIREYLKPDDLLLDMGTGGGEVLLTVNHPYHLTYITESYPPNFALCQKTLAPLGIHVNQVYGDCNEDLSFDDNMFDVVINRHESFDMKEVNRILKPNGFFITQQVGSDNDIKLRRALIQDAEQPFAYHTLENNADIIKNAGFEIILKEECFPAKRIFDALAVVYYAKQIPWEYPDFSVDNYFPRLLGLHEQIESTGFFENIGHRFIIAARKF